MDSIAGQIADQLASMDGLDQDARYVEVLRVAKIIEEAGEVMAALIAYHRANPRKPPGSKAEVITELCDVAITAAAAVELFGVNSEIAIHQRGRQVLERLRDQARSAA